MEIKEIKNYLKKNNITYEELAKRSNLSISTIKKIFSGISQYPRIDTVQAIERALGISSSAQLERTNSTDKTVLTEKQKRMLDAFNSLLPAMQEYVLGITEKLAAQTGIKNDKARIG